MVNEVILKVRCHLGVVNGGPQKAAIKLAQSYFSIQSRMQEQIDKCIRLLGDETKLIDLHERNNRSVRGRLGQRVTQIERLQAEEDIKKWERRVKSDQNKLEKRPGKLSSKESD